MTFHQGFMMLHSPKESFTPCSRRLTEAIWQEVSQVVDPNVSQQLSQEVDKAFDEYSRFLQEHAEVRDGIDSLGEARPDEVLLYIANNYSGSERDEGMRVVSNYFNAMAKKNGYMRKVGDNINNYVDEQVDSSGFKGMLDGEPDVKNIITVTDGEINPGDGTAEETDLTERRCGDPYNPWYYRRSKWY